MARLSRDKGQRIEREVVHLHQDAGIPASRVPLSGAAGGEFAGDLHVLDLRAEVKSRKDGSGFKQLETWLADHDMLFVRRDRHKPMVVLPWAEDICERCNGSRAPICAARRTTGAPRRSCWRGMGGSTSVRSPDD